MKLRIAFCHPDLGLGGAERLVVDAADELAALGHTVDVYTAYYDPSRCFEETTTGAFGVVVAGSWFPRHLFKRCHALCAYVRCILVALYLSWRSYRSGQQYDVVIVDQVSAVIPYLQWFTSAKVLFYCHFPDLLLAQRRSALHRLYRAPIDMYEQYTTGMADCVVVNSRYTQSIFAQTFRRLHHRGVLPRVLYPAVQVPPEEALGAAAAAWKKGLPEEVAALAGARPVFVSINRFERKKGIELAIEALALLHQRLASASSSSSTFRAALFGGGGPPQLPGLVVAGGYDERLAENREYYAELADLVAARGLEKHVAFMRSFTDAERAQLLAAARAVIYTPQHEHFGIVPLEAMAARRPVVACNNGGPTESVLHTLTGLLCEPAPQAFAGAMQQLLDAKLADRMGAAARRHVQDTFSRGAFGAKLQGIVFSLAEDDADSTMSG